MQQQEYNGVLKTQNEPRSNTRQHLQQCPPRPTRFTPHTHLHATDLPRSRSATCSSDATRSQSLRDRQYTMPHCCGVRVGMGRVMAVETAVGWLAVVQIVGWGSKLAKGAEIITAD